MPSAPSHCGALAPGHSPTRNMPVTRLRQGVGATSPGRLHRSGMDLRVGCLADLGKRLFRLPVLLALSATRRIPRKRGTAGLFTRPRTGPRSSLAPAHLASNRGPASRDAPDFESGNKRTVSATTFVHGGRDVRPPNLECVFGLFDLSGISTKRVSTSPTSESKRSTTRSADRLECAPRPPVGGCPGLEGRVRARQGAQRTSAAQPFADHLRCRSTTSSSGTPTEKCA